MLLIMLGLILGNIIGCAIFWGLLNLGFIIKTRIEIRAQHKWYRKNNINITYGDIDN